MRRFIKNYPLMTVLTCILFLTFMGTAIPGLRDRSSQVALEPHPNNRINVPQIATPSGNPPTDWLWIYAKNNGGTPDLYIEDDTGAVINMSSAASTLFDDISDPDANASVDFTTYTMAWTGAQTAGDGFTIENTGDFANISILKVQQVTGSPTDGTVLEVISADADTDALIVTANSTDVISVGGGGVLTLTGGAGVINFTEFDVSGTTGSIIINDGGDAGAITIESTVLDINSLDFVGAGAITAAASSAITLNPDGGDAAGEDLIVTAENVQLTATGALTMSPDVAVTTAMTVTDTDYTNALSVGTNAILGTTGLINYTNFDVDAAGAVVCTALDAGAGTIATTGEITATGNITSSGTITGASIAQDALVAATADTTITLDGTGTGGVGVGTASGTGTITLGGSATLVNLPSTVDMTLAGGDLAVTDTANADMVTFTNNTMLTADLLTLNATGTRTSNNMIAITDGSTTASTIAITANTQTSGNGIAYGNTGVGLTGAALYLAVTDGAGFTGDYINCYDGGAEDFTVERYGEVTIGGVASTDMLTVTTGDVKIKDGLLEIDTDEDDTSAVERAQATVTGHVFSVIEQTSTAASAKAALFVDQDTTTATSQGILIDSEGAVALAFSPLVVAGDAVEIDVANSYTGQGIVADLGPWIGTTGEGFIDITSDSGAVAESGQAIHVTLAGTTAPATAVDGHGIYALSDADYKAGQSLVHLDCENNIALEIFSSAAAADGIKIDVADSYTGQGLVADLGPWLGTAGEGFIHITTDGGAVAEAGQAIHIDLLGTTADAAAISGKALYAHDAAGATANSFLLHVESDVNGAAYLDGDIDVNFTNLDDNFNIVANATDYAAGDGTITVYDDSAGQTNTSYGLRLVAEAAADANNGMILCEVDSTGVAGNGTDVFEVDYAGSVTAAGSVTVNGPQLVGDGATEQVGFIKDIIDTGATNPYTATIAMSGSVFTNSQANQVNLPAAATGLVYTFVVGNASNFDINPDDADTITWHTCGVGDIVRSATVGDTITVLGISASTWVITSTAPADGNFNTDTVFADGGLGA